jgi:CHRD domain
MKKLMLLAGGAALALGLALAGSASAQMTMLSAKMDGKSETPAGDPKASGEAMFHVDTAKNQVCYELHTKDVAGIAAHIHKGAAGTSGPPVVMLKAPDASGKSEGCADAKPDVVQDLVSNPGGYYVNVHSAEFKGGAIRGQLTK